ncbi:Crp/Fnr family transcriptional regulator [Legionella fallonii]|uniref:Cyclic nucleotide-binding domain-containing protein n=1 Tax=Legionella fallonii LLAP-10 TaxID=1212491 RepID=A0A098FZA0_9GAMM|nr:cyclic nucleotide-binding domain-containing protein [Legionella fallonii]CEG55547.1 protein of unknown function [Cyclic nucleotide-binding] [Legionella fallonii LLAP-10]
MRCTSPAFFPTSVGLERKPFFLRHKAKHRLYSYLSAGDKTSKERKVIALEKLLLLKTVTLFKQTPDDLLLHIVTSIVKEKRANAGELLLEKGGVNSTMYIIVSGRVKVHDGERVIKELGEREVFGELSALTGGAPVSSVSIITDCLLLTISSTALYELMNFDAGISKGIIQALCKRTQAMSMQIQELLRG